MDDSEDETATAAASPEHDEDLARLRPKGRALVAVGVALATLVGGSVLLVAQTSSPSPEDAVPAASSEPAAADADPASTRSEEDRAALAQLEERLASRREAIDRSLREALADAPELTAAPDAACPLVAPLPEDVRTTGGDGRLEGVDPSTRRMLSQPSFTMQVVAPDAAVRSRAGHALGEAILRVRRARSSREPIEAVRARVEAALTNADASWEVVYVRTQHVVPEPEAGGSFRNGLSVGRAYAYRVEPASIACVGEVRATSSPEVLARDGLSVVVSEALEEDLVVQERRAVARSLRSVEP